MPPIFMIFELVVVAGLLFLILKLIKQFKKKD